jgi:hypothetical protein
MWSQITGTVKKVPAVFGPTASQQIYDDVGTFKNAN